ncbi:hypothetical protein ABIB73_002579 [Bradyrhizobium sp. F1.4.3]|uniref:hypothetical protein n=1 Tax=Bradyrhizobium sp. F1.4.3 TaxID=3156356 RepID=UPI0033952BDD
MTNSDSFRIGAFLSSIDLFYAAGACSLVATTGISLAGQSTNPNNRIRISGFYRINPLDYPCLGHHRAA